MKVKEKCSCGASFAIAVFANTPEHRWDWRMEQIKDWREHHRHEMPEESDQPIIHESGSSHERFAEPWPAEETRARIGFQVNH